MKLNNVINKIENLNNEVNKLDCVLSLEDIPEENITKAQSQYDMLEDMFKDFNTKDNSFIFRFKTTNNPNIRTIEFDKPKYINQVTLDVDNFVYDKLVDFKLIFYTLDNSAITYYMLPYNFRGEYLEEIKFFAGQKKSRFKTVNNYKILYYDIVKQPDDSFILSPTKIEYHTEINEYGYIIFNDKTRKDKICCRYSPISSEFKKNINDKITSVVLETTMPIVNNISLKFSE